VKNPSYQNSKIPQRKKGGKKKKRNKSVFPALAPTIKKTNKETPKRSCRVRPLQPHKPRRRSGKENNQGHTSPKKTITASPAKKKKKKKDESCQEGGYITQGGVRSQQEKGDGVLDWKSNNNGGRPAFGKRKKKKGEFSP